MPCFSALSAPKQHQQCATLAPHHFKSQSPKPMCVNLFIYSLWSHANMNRILSAGHLMTIAVFKSRGSVDVIQEPVVAPWYSSIGAFSSKKIVLNDILVFWSIVSVSASNSPLKNTAKTWHMISFYHFLKLAQRTFRIATALTVWIVPSFC